MGLRVIGSDSPGVSNFQVDTLRVFRPVQPDFPEYGIIFNLQEYLALWGEGYDIMAGSSYLRPSHTDRLDSLIIGKQANDMVRVTISVRE